MSLPVGSSPRNPSPLQRATASKAHVLSFPKAGLGTRQQRASWDAGNVSQQQHEAAANNTVPFRRSFAYGDNSSPRSLPPRMQTREKIAPRRVLQGFDLTHAAAPQEPLQRSSSSSNSAGLLTTQLSSSLTKGHATGEAPALDEQVPFNTQKVFCWHSHLSQRTLAECVRTSVSECLSGLCSFKGTSPTSGLRLRHACMSQNNSNHISYASGIFHTF